MRIFPLRPICIRLQGMLLLVACSLASGADAPRFAVPVQSSATTPVIGTLRVTLAMIAVLAAVLGAAWLMRRMRAGPGATAGRLQVLAQVPLGARERAVLLRAGDEELLIGVAPGSVRTLHVLARSSATDGGADAPSDEARTSFRSILLRSLGR